MSQTLKITTQGAKTPANVGERKDLRAQGRETTVNNKAPLTAKVPLPKQSSGPPDLLAIQFGSSLDDASGKMVSTGGMEWLMRRDDAGRWVWKYQPMGNKQRDELGGLRWRFTSPTNADFATETRLVTDPSTVTHPPKSGTPCSDCYTFGNPERSADGSYWVVGWSTDDTGDHAAIFRSLSPGPTHLERRWLPLTRGALPPARRAAAAAGHPWRWMPRWYLAMLVLSLVLAVPALLPPLPSVAQTESVEGRLSSDKPLSPGDYDALGITSIALGLSRFLRNEKTLPPLTIAVNGEWGSGKSSLMNLLRCDLESYGMFPVWFNAWHHQKEEHLLAALLQTLRVEAVPPLWNLLGVPFRLRLLSYRLRRRWPVLVAVSALVVFLVVLDYRVRIDDQTDLFLWLTSQILPSFSGKPSTPVSTVPVQGGLVALLAGIGILWKGLTAFGANPASLLASVAQGNKIKDLEAQTSFRQKFAEEFRDFTRALGPRRPLTIFIDDLDRCLPTNVRDVLEAVNFLVSSGDCFVVLGMDRLQVQRAVGLSFKEVADEIVREPESKAKDNTQASPMGGSSEASQMSPQEVANRNGDPPKSEVSHFSEIDDKEQSRQNRADFAQKYLEKLINLEVRIPMAADDETKKRLFEKAPHPEPVSWRETALQVSLTGLQWAVPVALAILLVIGGYQLSRSLAAVAEESMKSSRLSSAPAPTVTAGTNVSSIAPSAKLEVATESQDLNNKPANVRSNPSELSTTDGTPVNPIGGLAPKYTAGRDAWPARWILCVPFYFVGICLLLVANVALTTRPGVVTKDSQPFTDALEQVWYPVVLAKQSTPRAAKRFVNRVRYLAMRQRGFHEQASMWERVLYPQRLREPAGAVDPSAVPEPLLVAMAAIEQLEPSLIYDKKAFDGIVSTNGKPPDQHERNDSSRIDMKLVEQARSKHQEDFRQAPSDWNSLPTYRARFVSIWPRTDPTKPATTPVQEASTVGGNHDKLGVRTLS
jgi:hypothetical protein